MEKSKYKTPIETLIQLSKNQKNDQYSPEKIISNITEQKLLKIQKLMRQHSQLNVAEFLRFFLSVFSNEVKQEDQFYFLYGLFKIFKEICRNYKTSTITFSQLSSFMTQKMPTANQQVIVKQKLLPIGFTIPKQEKANIVAPQIQGKMIHQRQFLQKFPYQFDKFQHINRCIAQACYSPEHEMFMTIDLPSNSIRMMDKNFNQITSIYSQLQISKKQSIISYIVWSQAEGKLGAILGNYSLSFWAKQDNYRFQVNVPLPPQNLAHPYVVLGYMESIKTWYAIDNRPVIYILSSRNFQPVHLIKNFKMIKQKPTEKIFALQMKYQKLLCIGFQRKIFLLSLQTREVVTEFTNFKTSITSLVFSQTYQALLVSNYEIHFKAFQLTQFCDLTQKGRFQGHKHQIVLLGVLQKRPVVYSLQQNWLMKLWDIRDFTCYQTFSVLKNINYLQMFTINGGICLVGSKLYMYRWISQKNQNSRRLINNESLQKVQNTQKVILITQIQKNILIITSKTIKIYSYHSGNLIKVIKGIFELQQQISFAYFNDVKKQLYLSTQQGKFLILQTETFSKIYEFNFLSNPFYMNYSQKEDLISLVALGQVHIMEYKKNASYDLKRKIFNEKQKIINCKISSLHDLILIVYENNEQNSKRNTIFFYTYERSKIIGCFDVQDFVRFQLHPEKNILIVLCAQELKIFTFKKTVVSISFDLHYQIKLWQGELYQSKLSLEFLQFQEKITKLPIKAYKMFIIDNTLSIVSNFSCLVCQIKINWQNIFPGYIQVDKNNYNPYRISVERHNQLFATQFVSEISNKTSQSQKLIVSYFRNKIYAKTLGALKLGNLLGIFNNKLDLHFYDSKFNIVGVINNQLTLPKVWDMYFYDEYELQEIQFVLEFIENEQKQKKKMIKKQEQKEGSNNFFNLTLSKFQKSSPSKKSANILTIDKILKTYMKKDQKAQDNYKANTHSLRQRKLMLQKQREQKERLQNFLQYQEQQEINKIRSYNSQDNQDNINEILNFFAINRNQVVKNRGIKQVDYPKVKLLQRKLQNSLKKDDKKTMSPKHNLKIDMLINKNLIKASLDPFETTSKLRSFKVFDSVQLSNDSPYKNSSLKRITQNKMLIKILNEQVRNSKISNRSKLKQRNLSLPVLKKMNK